MSDESPVSVELLKSLAPLEGMKRDNLAALARKVGLRTASAGRTLFKEGERDKRSVWLVSGLVELREGDKTVAMIRGGTPEARNPLSHFQPRKFTARAVDEVEYLSVDSELLDVMITWDQTGSYEVSDLRAGDAAGTDDWMTTLLSSSSFQRIPPSNIQAIFMRMQRHSAKQLASQDQVKAYVFGDENDMEKTEKFCALLDAHKIDVYNNNREIQINGFTFPPGKSYVVPLNQKQYRLIKSVFGITDTFSDSTFYDVSTWTLPYAFDIPSAEITSGRDVKAEGKWTAKSMEGIIFGGKNNLGYLFRWNKSSAPEVLFRLQNAGLKTKVAKEDFSFNIGGKKEDFSKGTIYVSANGQSKDKEMIHSLIAEIAKETGTDFYSPETGLSPQGIDLGSNNFVLLNKPEVLMLTGSGASSREAGEIWHLFDQVYHIPVCLCESSQLNQTDLKRYNTLILPGGSFSNLDNTIIQKIKTWVREGGILVANTSSTAWTVKNELSRIKFKKQPAADTAKFVTYAYRSKENSINSISGAIFEAGMDLSHPLCFGYTRAEIPVFKTGTTVVERLQEKNSVPVVFTDSPYVSGFVSEKNLERIRNSAVVAVESYGNGKVITYNENMTFRGIWRGTNKLFVNSVFFGKIIR